MRRGAVTVAALARLSSRLLQADGFRIFLASPSRLDDYRVAAREQVEHIRLTIARPRGIQLDPIGWEDLPPSFGRPQSVINPKLDECNALIGILGKHLGTPTGEAASGFVEEYERMAVRARSGEDVKIWVYVLRLSPEDVADPGDKLKAVLAFRQRVYDEALVKEFRNVDHFAGQLYRDLASLVLDADKRWWQPSESEAVPATVETRPAPRQAPADEAARQLRTLLAEAAEAVPSLPERFGEERFPLARLRLWLSAWEGWHFTNETFGVHELNQLYVMRDRVALASLERQHILRTVCARRPIAPGWALLGYNDVQAAPALLMRAGGDVDAAVRVGALELLERGPVDAWLSRPHADVDRQRIFHRLRDEVDDVNDVVRDAMMGFAVRMGGDEARRFLVALSESDPTHSQAVQALIRLDSSEHPHDALQRAMRVDLELDDQTLAAVRAAAAHAELGELVGLTDAHHEPIRIVAIELLAARGTAAVPALVARLNDPADDVALAAFLALAAIADQDLDLAGPYRMLRQRDGLKFNDDLRRAFDRTLDTQALRDSIDWPDVRTSSAYQILAEERWDEFRDAVRRDLGDRFTTFAAESRARFTVRLGKDVMEAIETGAELHALEESRVEPIDPELVNQIREFLAGSDLNIRRFAAAALTGVARHGVAEDASRVRPWLDSKFHDVREAAALALARTGTADDVLKLLELSRLHEGEIFARAALRLSPGPSGAALELLDSSRGAGVLVAARRLYSHASDLSEETLRRLLHHTREDVRRVGVACLLTGRDDRELAEILNRYTSEGRYYYDVVFWLDRVLFAPPYLRTRTRAELEVFAAEQDSRERPSGLHRALMDHFGKKEGH